MELPESRYRGFKSPEYIPQDKCSGNEYNSGRGKKYLLPDRRPGEVLPGRKKETRQLK
jgi:hypothetical protein